MQELKKQLNIQKSVKNFFLNRESRGRNILFSVILGILLGIIILSLVIGQNIGTFFEIFFTIGFKSDDNFRNWIQKLTIFILIGLAIGLCLKAGLLNIGVSGQMMFGAMCAYLVFNQSSLDRASSVVVGIIICVLGATALALLAGALKTYFNVNEVLTTLMSNWIATFLILYTANNTTGNALTYDAGINHVFEYGDPYNWNVTAVGIVITIIAIGVIWYLLNRTAYGFKIKVTGFNPRTAQYAGFNARSITLSTFAISGILAGLAGYIMFIQAADQIIVTNSTPIQEGFQGIAVALVGMSNPVGIILSGILFTFLTGPVGDIPLPGLNPNVSWIFAGTVVYFVAASNLFLYFQPKLSWSRYKAKRAALKQEREQHKIRSTT